MLKSEEIVMEFIEEIESSVKKGFDKNEFIKSFREKIEQYIIEKIP